MLRRLSLAIAVACATAAHAQEPTSSVNTDLLYVYQQAAQNNADLAAARAGLAARQEGVPQARAGLLPSIGVTAGVSDSRTALEQPSATVERSGASWRASLSQPLFRADRWFGLKAAEAVSEQAALEYSASEQGLILNSAEAYFAVLRAQDALATARAEEAAFRRQLEQANERFQVGLSDRTDTLQAQAGYDTARAGRLLAERSVSDALENLTTLTNRRFYSLEGIRHDLPILPPTPNDAVAWVDTAVAQNLRLQASAFAVDAARQTVSQRRSGHAPTLDAVASFERGDNDALGFSNTAATRLSGLPAYGGEVDQRVLGLQLSIPLYSGGLTTSQSRQAYHLLEQSEQNRESLRRQVVQNTRNLHRAVNTDVEQVAARRQSIVSNQGALEATEVGYEVGTRNIVDVLDAQRQLYAAVRDYNDSRYDYILDNLRLKQAAGTLAPDDLVQLAQYLDPNYDPARDFLPPDLQGHDETPATRP